MFERSTSHVVTIRVDSCARALQVSKVDVMQENKECADLLTQAKDYHIVVSKQPLLQNNRTQV